jgi:hypothetical protein
MSPVARLCVTPVMSSDITSGMTVMRMALTHNVPTGSANASRNFAAVALPALSAAPTT